MVNPRTRAGSGRHCFDKFRQTRNEVGSQISGRERARVIRIFLADDHPMIQTALEALLDGTGRTIVGRATSGAEALERIGRVRVDVIILDVQMPGGSGIHVLRELRKRGDKRPVILLTAAIDDEALRQALALSANGIVLKSSDPSLLIE